MILHRLLVFPLLLLLGGCASNVTQRDILARSKAEVGARESWSDIAFIRVASQPDGLRLTWKVVAGAFDYSDYPVYKGINLAPGTRRELHFTPDGCLVSYTVPNQDCLAGAAYAPVFREDRKGDPSPDARK